MKEFEQEVLNQLKINNPKIEDIAAKGRFLTDIEKQDIFLQICNRFGEEGWEVSHLMFTGKHYLFMRKQGYTTK